MHACFSPWASAVHCEVLLWGALVQLAAAQNWRSWHPGKPYIAMDIMLAPDMLAVTETQLTQTYSQYLLPAGLEPGTQEYQCMHRSVLGHMQAAYILQMRLCLQQQGVSANVLSMLSPAACESVSAFRAQQPAEVNHTGTQSARHFP